MSSWRAVRLEHGEAAEAHRLWSKSIRDDLSSKCAQGRVEITIGDFERDATKRHVRQRLWNDGGEEGPAYRSTWHYLKFVCGPAAAATASIVVPSNPSATNAATAASRSRSSMASDSARVGRPRRVTASYDRPAKRKPNGPHPDSCSASSPRSSQPEVVDTVYFCRRGSGLAMERVNTMQGTLMALRVVQWTTGNVGKRSVRAVAADPNLELVGCFAWSTDKVGTDVGELCRIEPLGVAATNDVDALLALKPDVVVYNPMWPSTDEVVRILAAGVNVVTTKHSSTVAMPATTAEHSRRTCAQGRSTIFGTGISLFRGANRRPWRPPSAIASTRSR